MDKGNANSLNALNYDHHVTNKPMCFNSLFAKNDRKHKLYMKEIPPYYINNALIVLLNEEKKNFDYLNSKIWKRLIQNFADKAEVSNCR